MKNKISHRLLSLVMVLAIALGLIPGTMPTTAEAALPEDQLEQSAILSDRITSIEGTLKSKYEQVNLFKGFPAVAANSTLAQVTAANNELQGLTGRTFIFVTSPVNGLDKDYALNPTQTPEQGKLSLTEVTVGAEGDLFGVDPSWAFTIERDTGSEANIKNDEYMFPETKGNGSARAHFYLQTRNGQYLHNSNTVVDSSNNSVGVKLLPDREFAKTSITLFASFVNHEIQIFQSGYYKVGTGTNAKYGTHYIGLNLSDPNNAYVQTLEVKSGVTRPGFFLYEENPGLVHAEPLYQAILEAKAYLNNCNPYEEEHYDEFLYRIESALELFAEVNGKSFSASEIVAKQTAVDTQTKALKEATTLIKPYDEQIRDMRIPVTEKVTALPSNEVLDGTYFLVGWDDSSFYYALNGTKLYSETYSQKLDANNTNKETLNVTVAEKLYVSVEGNRLYADDLTAAIDVRYAANSGYSLLLSNGQYLGMKNGSPSISFTGMEGMRSIENSTPQLMQIIRGFAPSSGSYTLSLPENRGYSLRLCNNGKYFRAWYRTYNETETSRNRDYDTFFYKVSPLTLELYKALKRVEIYAGGNDGRYDSATYDAFVALLSQSLDNYRDNCNSNYEDPVLQAQLDADAAALKEYARILTLADSSTSYIDIPMEVLDFRSDKFLFEYHAGSAAAIYSLAALRDPNNELSEYYNALNDNTELVYQGSTYYRQGLTEPSLVNGRPVYADHTVGYIAASIVSDWMFDENSSYHTKYESQIEDYNNSFEDVDWQDALWSKMESIYNAYAAATTDAAKKAVLGSFSETLKNTDTGENGGTLLWDDIVTAFDLAYYALNNIWRPVGDTFHNGEAYNTLVTERDTMRMYLDEETGWYTIDSTKHLVYDDYAMYNTMPPTVHNRERFPAMAPINGLGFEKYGNETDPSTYFMTQGYEEDYQDVNFGFAIHAGGSFVYYEDQEQFFEFMGDDDVYFFINGKLVMDIGGSHGAAGYPSNLREANTKFNLGLEDEGVYTFDMFFAERHTKGSNMRFVTNINIVRTDTVTTMGQYAVEVRGGSTVDSTTGKGVPLIDNQPVNLGDVVAYSFDIANTRANPVIELEFHDPSLGINLSKDYIAQYTTTLTTGQTAISLTNPNEGYSNGVATLFKDLIVEYTTYDGKGNLATGAVQELSATDMAKMIRHTVTLPENAEDYKYAPLDPGIYRVRVNTADQLKLLLEVGVPMSCHFSLYGFLRKTVSSDTPYTNELTTHCTYRRSSNINAIFAVMTGKASRILRVPNASHLPHIERVELVLDYGKDVAIPLKYLPDQISFDQNSAASVGDVLGVVKDGFSGQLLKKAPTDLLCTTTEDPAKARFGTFTREGDNLIYSMEAFMDQVEPIYAVVKLNDFILENTEVQYEYALVEICLVPANMMYYEAEDFAETELSYVQIGGTASQAPDGTYIWETKTDGTKETYQDFDPVGYETHNIVIDRDSIPSEAFFADFDGLGYSERYRDLPQYKGYNFDTPEAWFKHSVRTVSVDTQKGVLSLSIPDNISEEYNYYHYTQTIIPGNNGNSTPLSLKPGEGHVFRIRFRVENCTPKEGTPTLLCLMLSDDKRNNIISPDDSNAKETDYLKIPLDAEKVFSGEYYTVTASMDPVTYYTQADLIDAFRFQFQGMISNGSGRIQVDYVYLGPEVGMKQEAYGNYLYFGFTNTAADLLRYSSSIYGSTASNIRNYDTVANWSSNTAGDTIQITNDGYLVFSDRSSNEWNCVDAAATVGEDPIRYKTTGNDVYQIRFKISGNNVVPESGQTPLVALQFADGGSPAAYCQIDLDTFMDGEFHTLTMPMNTSFFAGVTELNRVRIDFSHIIGDATFTIDYIYIGPASLVNKAADKADYLLFDFSNTDSDKLRYSNSAYGALGYNYDTGRWHYNYSYTTVPSFDNQAGTMSFTTTAACPTDRHIHTVITSSNNSYTGGHPLSYKPTGKDYFKIRMKITGSTDVNANFRLRYGADDIASSDYTNAFDCPIPTGAINNRYFILEGYANFGDADTITAIRPEVYNLLISDPVNQPVTFTFDYIYVGPRCEVNTTTDSLFFGFENTEEDQARYGSHTYGGMNYDYAYTFGQGDKGIGHWATSPQINPTTTDYVIDNDKGILTVPVTDTRILDPETNEYAPYGPYLITTNLYGGYSMSADRASLNYRPENADILQIRFRVTNSEAAPGTRPNVIFLFGGYDKLGNYKDYNTLPYMRTFYTPSESYQVVTIRLSQEVRELAVITNLGLRFQHILSHDNGSVEIDYIYVGSGDGAPYTYGYDSSYDSGSLLSDGESLYLEGTGCRTETAPNPDAYTEAYFSFTGTGFDLISCTNKDGANLRIEIFTDPSRSAESRVVAVPLYLKGETDMYQLPVYSKDDLPHGTYYVTIGVDEKYELSWFPALSRGNQFYLDAIRIYNPIDVSKGNNAPTGSDSAIAYSAYCADGEAHPDIRELRNILLSADSFNANGAIQDGAVFVDYTSIKKETITNPDNNENIVLPSDPSITDHVTYSIETYKKVGPNNEVYLGPEQMVAFQLFVYSKQIPARVDIGAKAITSAASKLNVKLWDNESQAVRFFETDIKGPGHQYYSMHLNESMMKGTTDENGKPCYKTTILISNPISKGDYSPEPVLSITDIKIAYTSKPTELKASDIKSVTRSDEVELPTDDFVAIRFVVEGDLMGVVGDVLKEQYNPCTDHAPGTWETVVRPSAGQEGLSQLRCSLCGVILEEEILAAIPQLAFTGASVSLHSDLSIHYKVKESFFTELGFTDPYVVIHDNGVETVIRNYDVKDGNYSFVYRNIAPHRIGDTVTATLYAYYGGTLYSSKSRDYSVADYCYNMLGKTGSNDSYAKLRTLLVDILHYGAKTQEFMSYRLDSLCNSRLTEEQLVWGTELTRELVSHRDEAYEAIDNPTVIWQGAGLNLRESVAVRFKIQVESYEDLEVRITLAGRTYTIYAKDFDYREDGTYVHFRSINAAQMSEPIYFAAFRNGEQVSHTICYSIESYAYAKQNDTIPHLADLVKRMMCYGDSTKAYVG